MKDECGICGEDVGVSLVCLACRERLDRMLDAVGG
jgi:hypothetical protein